jgi:hypothetical protein
MAVWTLARSFSGKSGSDASAPAFAGFYLGWLFQATYIQHQLAYQMVPGVILSLTLLAGAESTLLGERHRGLKGALGLCAFGFIVWCLVCHPLLAPARIKVWSRCWSEGSSAEIRNALTVETDLASPDWVRLDQIETFLRGKHLRNHQLTCYAPSTIHVYRDLDIKPSTRFVLLMPAMGMFQGHRVEIADEVRRSPERYILSDMVLLGVSRPKANRGDHNLSELPPPGRNAPPDYKERYPYIFPPIFRAGRYLVHDRYPMLERS